MWQLGYKGSLISLVCLFFTFGYSVASGKLIDYLLESTLKVFQIF